VHPGRLGERQGFSGIARQPLAHSVVSAFDMSGLPVPFRASAVVVRGDDGGIRFPAIGVGQGPAIAGWQPFPELAGRRCRAIAEGIGDHLAGVSGEGNPQPDRLRLSANIAPKLIELEHRHSDILWRFNDGDGQWRQMPNFF
jgi:hypothetical protein